MANNYTRKELEQLICEVLGYKTVPPMVSKQINRFILDYNMSFKEIARCLVWYVEVHGAVMKPEYGIGILPNIREQAEQYFIQLELDQQKQAAEANKVAEYQDNNIIFNIKSLKHKKRQPKQFDIGDIKVDKGDKYDN